MTGTGDGLALTVAQRARRLLRDVVPDRVILARRFRSAFGRPLDLRHPTTFNEKIYWLMLYYRVPLMSQLADKYAVRSYVTERVGPHILNELYGVWDRARDIAFADLPETFALKVNWGWRMNLFCRDRASFDPDAARRQVAAWMRRSHYWRHREWAYRNIRPRVTAERLLHDPAWSNPVEHCFFCFDGEPAFIRVHTDRDRAHGTDHFDLDWKPAPFGIQRPNSGRPLPRPSNLEEMADCARRLSGGWPFVRVDLFGIGGRTIFQEMTWYPSAGLSRFMPESYDRYWGDRLRLPAPRY
jgi:TupA-like ATPgrasp